MLSYRWEAIRKKIGTKNLALLLLAGICLLISGMSSTKQKEPEKEAVTDSGQTAQLPAGNMAEEDVAEKLEERLVHVLQTVKGVGKVQVMLTLADEGEHVILKDLQTTTESLNESDASGGSRIDVQAEKKETTIYENGSSPYVTKEISAKVSGVLIVCEGGGNPEIVVQIVSATEALFQVSAHRIVVLEMK